MHRYSEVEAKYPVTVFTGAGHLEGETQLINHHGALICCQQPPGLHETTTVSIQFSEHESLLVEAKVMMLHFPDPDESHVTTPRGMVVRFESLSTVGRQCLRNVIAKHYAKKVKRLSPKNQNRPE